MITDTDTKLSTHICKQKLLTIEAITSSTVNSTILLDTYIHTIRVRPQPDFSPISEQLCTTGISDYTLLQLLTRLPDGIAWLLPYKEDIMKYPVHKNTYSNILYHKN